MPPIKALLANLEQLVSQFAQALKQLSRSAAPVVLFIDTAELLDDKALKRLRRAAQDSGSKVVWVLGLRLEAASDARHASEAARFREDVRPTRLWSMPLTSFDAHVIEAYLRGRLGDRYPKGGLDITAVARRTYGVPLAVSLIGQRLADGQDLATVLSQRQHYELFKTSGLAAGINALTGIWRDIIARDNSAAGPGEIRAPCPNGNPAISGEDSSTD